MIRPWLAAPILLVTALANGQQPDDKYAPKDGRYAVRFPGKPKELIQNTKSPIGELKIVTATYALADGSVYMVSYTDFPEGATKPDNRKMLFDGVRDGLKGKDAKVLSEKDVEVGADKLPARDIEIEKGKQRMKFRVILRDSRLYQVAAIGAVAFVTGKDAAAFFESFELTK
jgi:hypothetical protein